MKALTLVHAALQVAQKVCLLAGRHEELPYLQALAASNRAALSTQLQ